MNETLPAIYIIVLLVLLSAAGIFVFRQVWRTRRNEGRLSQLQSKLRSEEGTPQDFYELGSIYLQKKLFVQASKVLQRALKGKGIEPENRALAYNALGYAYIAQEQTDLAIRQYKEAVKLYPDYTIAWNNLADAYERKSLTAQAIDAYEHTLALDPSNSVAKRRVASLRKRIAPNKPVDPASS
ncbi:tetratricopeptide TPR_11 repeat-containing protein [Rubidibacter lacunae KORDI 51-2]|uniref:Tetratricopeptide TPR_11 repeat-containing protein n=1 Tax=Rubidibacter lacunae KORDI 51-2 TaxID=582515 RepID=U5DFM2_9CHRO|nr:tetratricopeptide repeat protein [Rubidibacter lacunae]ERN40396.1 tetratricopeptide TPR_11 repeat-containing protein [Rubidibacter lacunae KORDI 51-2]